MISPSILCAFVFLLLAILLIVCSIDRKGTFKVWHLCLLISLVFGVLGNVVTAIGLIYASVVGCIAFFYSRQQKGWMALLLTLVSLPLFFHLPQFGFHNYPFLDHIRITPDAIPYSLYFNYDKTLVPVFVLGFSGKTITGKKWLEVIRNVLFHLLLLAPLMLGVCWLLRYVTFAPKWPVYTPVWMLVNLFFTCTAEEVLFREVIQGGLEKKLTLSRKGYVAIVVSALLFGIMHYAGGTSYIFLATIAGLFYGHVFYVTREIRSSVLLHFLLNMLHFLLFTYPALEH